MNWKSLQQIVQFFYTAQVEITEKNVQDLLSTASLLQVQNVLDACCEFMRRKLTDENCLGRLQAEYSQYQTTSGFHTPSSKFCCIPGFLYMRK